LGVEVSTVTPAQAANGAEAMRAAAASDPGAMSDYYRRVESHLARFHTYPATLAGARPTGVVRVGLIVQRDGRLYYYFWPEYTRKMRFGRFGIIVKIV
jgi:outer membrane biosynthesis protein TonB